MEGAQMIGFVILFLLVVLAFVGVSMMRIDATAKQLLWLFIIILAVLWLFWGGGHL